MAQRRIMAITEEIVGLFARGLELQAEGHDDTDDESTEHDEYRALDKRLCWSLLELPPHMVSPLDPMLDGQMPAYMARLTSGRDWDISVQWRQALLQAVEVRRQHR
jgi:hypothetical protein